MQRPNIQIFRIDLGSRGILAATATTGMQDISVLANKLKVLRFEDVNGVPLLDGQLFVQIGREGADPIPLAYNGAIKAHTDLWRITWALQPGYTAVVVLSETDSATGVEVDSPPARQLVTSSAGTTINAGGVVVGVVATVIAAASSTRQSVTIRNNSAQPIELGGAGVTYGTGLPLYPNESCNFNGTTAAIYGISNVAGLDVRFFSEQ